MRSNFKPVGMPKSQRAARSAPTTGIPPGQRVSHPEFPLERVCSHRSEPFQLAFARNALQLFCEREDVDLVASHRGLTIGAETEDAIDSAIVVLEDSYGSRIRVGPPTVRYHEGATLEEPWMGLRVRCAVGDLDAVSIDLTDRNATITGCDIQAEHGLIQGCAPLASLIGYRGALEKLTDGSARHAIWLSHYAPLGSLPPDGEAA